MQVPNPTEAQAEAEMAAGQIPTDSVRWRQFVLLFLNAILNEL